MSKDLIRGFLLAHNAPKEVMDALYMFDEPTPSNSSQLPALQDLLDEMRHENQGARAINCIKNEGIETTEDLLQYTSRFLLRVPNFGRVSLRAIETVLSKHNLKLAS